MSKVFLITGGAGFIGSAVIRYLINNYGPFQYPEKLIPRMIINALNGNNMPIYGSGEQIRDRLFVDDHVIALIEVVTNGESGDTYNIGGNNEMCNIDVVKAICSELDIVAIKERPSTLNKYSDLVVHINDRPGHDFRYAINTDRIKNQLGWTPKENFKSGLTKTVQWYLNNRDWWANAESSNDEIQKIDKIKTSSSFN